MTRNSTCCRLRLCATLIVLWLGIGTALAQSQDSPGSSATKPAPPKAVSGKEVAPRENLAKEAIAKEMPIRKSSASAAPTPKEIGNQVREALEAGVGKDQQMTLKVAGKERPPAAANPVSRVVGPASAAASPPPLPMIRVPPGAIPNPAASREYARARAAQLAAPTGSAGATGVAGQWSYEGDTGPSHWASLRPEFSLCATGKRQSPINIDEMTTLRGPAEPIRFDYSASNASVVNNGHTIQVDVLGNNSISLRGSVFRLQHLRFHHPGEIRVNQRGFAMAAHLVHRSDEGQLAVLALLMEPGNAANDTIDKIWTYMPLDVGDRVRMPDAMLDLGALLPQDTRYYQFMGSLSTPPCTEGVLWIVLKQPVAIGRDQLRLFSQLFPNNARPTQPLHGRAVRDAQ